MKRNSRKGLILIAILLLLSFVLGGCKGEQEETTIQVFIAASLKNAMEELQTEYTKENANVKILYNADSSGTLQKQIQEGADCDIFFSAATTQMDELNEGGYIESDSVVPLLENEVVLITGKDTQTRVTGFEDITKAANLALAGEDVPAGQYAREILKNMGIFDRVKKLPINECTNVTAVLSAVSEKSNEIGIVYATDAVSVKDSVTVIAKASKEYLKTPVVYPIGLVKNKQATLGETKAAKKYFEYICSDSGKKILKKYGFTVKSQ